MSLYDGYQLANSTQVKQYQGSTAPELIKVSEELQNRYDSAQEGTDWVNRFAAGMDALPGDKPALQEAMKGYKERLSALAQRPDLENSLREVSMLARDVPQTYAPFAQRKKDAADYQEQVRKDTQDGKITQTTAERLIGMSQKRDKGIQLDPTTGRYTGRWQGANYVKDVNVAEKVDKYLNGAYPTTEGYSHENVEGQWIVKKAGKVVSLPVGRINEIIQSGIAADGEMQSWIKQEQDLGTYNDDYSTVGQLDSNAVLGKDGKGVPVTLGAVLKPYLDKGYSQTDAVKMMRRDDITKRITGQAVSYGANKYFRNDVTTESGISANPYEVQNAGKETANTIPITTPVFQPSGGSIVTTGSDMTKAIKTNEANLKGSTEAYGLWQAQNGVTLTKGSSPYSPEAQFKDKNGTDVSFEARKYLDAQTQNSAALKQMKDREKTAMDRANFHVTPELRRKAEDARNTIFSMPDQVHMAPGYVPNLKSKTERGEDMYQSIIKDTDGYRKYEQILAEDQKANMTPVMLSTFKNPKLNEVMNEKFKGIVLDLDAKGLDAGTQGLLWASGENTGHPLTADEYKKMIGDAQYLGASLDTDGQYKQFFKVGTSKVNAKGEPVGESGIVKMPVWSGVVENLIKDGQYGTVTQILGESILKQTTTPSPAKIQLDDKGNSVTVRKVQPSERTAGSRYEKSEYSLSYALSNGGVQEVPAENLAEAVSSIQRTMKNELKK